HPAGVVVLPDEQLDAPPGDQVLAGSERRVDVRLALGDVDRAEPGVGLHGADRPPEDCRHLVDGEPGVGLDALVRHRPTLSRPPPKLTPVQFALTVLDGVRWQGRPVAGARPQALLAALVRGDRGPVGDRGLIEAVWEDTPPADPAKALQVLVSRTRAACATEVIIRDPAGYRLGPPAEQVDALALARAVDRVRGLVADGAAADAIDLAERALAVPVALEPDASPAVIAELRAAARDRRAELARLLGIARSRAGDHAAALELLEPLVGGGAVAPEPVLAALLRSEAAVRGPAAALERFESHRRDLADRWGTDPGPELRRVHAHLLALDRPVRTGVQYEPAGLIGRDDAVRAVLGRLDAHRVVSLIGPGGLGKTRLAHAVGRAAGQPVVRLVELVGIGTDDEVIL